MRQLVVLALIGTPFIVSAAYQPPRDPGSGIEVKDTKGEDWMPPSFHGKVVGLTKDTITIKPEGNVRFTETLFLGGGPFRTRVYVQDNTKPPRAFTFHDNLLYHSGLNPNFQEAVGPLCGHKIGDLELGDTVEIGCRRYSGVDYCISFEIRRRPGGKVPPAIGDEHLSEQQRWDNRMNAEQFVEEKVLPKLMPRVGLQFVR